MVTNSSVEETWS